MISVTPSGSSPADANNINAALARGAGCVALAAGTYVIGPNDQIRFPAGVDGVSLIGEGCAATNLQFSPRHTDGVVMPGPNADCCIRDIGLVGLGSAGPGWALLRLTNTHNVMVDRLQVLGTYSDGVAIDGGPQQFIASLTNVDIDAVPGTGYRALVVGQNAVVQDLYLTTCKTAQTQFGIWLANVSGFYEINSQCYAHQAHGLLTYPTGAQACEWFQLTGHLSDSCGGTGVYLGSGGGVVRGITFTNLWSSSNQIGMEIWNGVNDLQITGRRLLANHNQAVIDYGASAVFWWPSPP